jgi:hypothetical protein
MTGRPRWSPPTRRDTSFDVAFTILTGGNAMFTDRPEILTF